MPSHVKALIADSPDDAKADLVSAAPVNIMDWYVWYAAVSDGRFFHYTTLLSCPNNKALPYWLVTCKLVAQPFVKALQHPRHCQSHLAGDCCRHITEDDLDFFKDRVERDVDMPGVGKWQHMTDLKLDTLTYSAWRRRLAVRSHAIAFLWMPLHSP